MSLRDRRVQYETAGLERNDLDNNPLVQWQRWYDQAAEAAVAEPNAMTLSTIGVDGGPDSRIVLVRGVDETGFAFYTNYNSAKSKQLVEHAQASAVFGWLDLHRQVRVRGRVTRLSDRVSDEYFASRPRESQLGAWASPQSQPIASRDELISRLAEAEQRFLGRDVERPPHWGGWVLKLSFGRDDQVACMTAFATRCNQMLRGLLSVWLRKTC
jgi:pyridoxamine 5'-phosphate oxidase